MLGFPWISDLLHLILQTALWDDGQAAAAATAFCGLASLCFPGMAYSVGPFLTSINHMTAFAHGSLAEGPGRLHSVSAAFNLLDRAHAALRLHPTTA